MQIAENFIQTQDEDLAEVKISKDAPLDKKLPTALFIARDHGGCGFYRCIQPASALRLLKLFNTIVDLKLTTKEHIDQADIIIFQAAGTSQAVNMMNYAKEQGKPVVIETDDYLHCISPRNDGGYGAWNPGTLYLYRWNDMIKKADAMIVATPQLAREHFIYNKNIYVLPNYLDEEKWTLQKVKSKDDYLRIGWAGGNAHGDDLRMIASVVEQIVRDHKDKVKFETMGMLKQELKDTFSNLEEFSERCPKCNYQGDSIPHPGDTLDNYPLVLASYGWDIGLAPIINNAFNSSKSDLKLKEYSAFGIPIVASRVTPYIEAEKLGCRVLLAESYEEWYNKIKELIESPNLRKEIVDANREWISSYWIHDNIDKYANVFKQIIDQKESLLQIHKPLY